MLNIYFIPHTYTQFTQATMSDDYTIPPIFHSEEAFMNVDIGVRSKNPSRSAPPSFVDTIKLVMTTDGKYYHLTDHKLWDCIHTMPVRLDTGRILTHYPSAHATRVPLGSIYKTITDSSVEYYDYSQASVFYVLTDTLLPADMHACDGCVHVGEVGPCEEVLALTVDGDKKWFTVGGDASTAHFLTSKGFMVFPGTINGAACPKLRVQVSYLKWVKDIELEESMIRYSNYIPGIDYANCTATDGATLKNTVYGSDMGVPRSCMSWGALAAIVCKPFIEGEQLTPPDFRTMFEPLASYSSALLSVQTARCSGKEKALPRAVLKYNCPPKMTPAQCAHACSLYYWAAIHRHTDTLAIPRDAAKAALEIYMRFGCVVLQKRAYEFHATN